MAAYIFVFLEGIIAFISPCILPMFPVYVMYLTGKPGEGRAGAVGSGGGADSLGGEGRVAVAGGDSGKKGESRLVTNTLGFILGFTIIFVLMGATATLLGSLVLDNKLILQRVSGAVIVLFGLSFAGVIKIPFLDAEKRFRANTSRLGFFSSVLFGAAFSFGWSPCLGKFLGAAFMLAANRNTVAEGMFMLFLFSLGLGVPFFICTVIIDRLAGVFGFIKKNYRVITVVSGAILVVAGLALMFNVFGYWSALFGIL